MLRPRMIISLRSEQRPVNILIGGGFARSVGAEEAVKGPGFDTQVNTVDGAKKLSK